jgi:hypothetical protein
LLLEIIGLCLLLLELASCLLLEIIALLAEAAHEKTHKDTDNLS